ncbi:MAG TPA: hypothetical protein VN032_08255, partial [Thermoanaerobaculia bacterium]|nr:hypothetical protein [Thermoanaerobaculia bacterium]
MSGTDDGPEVEQSASESDLLGNRRENLRRVEELGFPSSPVRFGITATISAIREQFGDAAAESLEAEKPAAVTAGRVLALRTA